MGDFPLGSYFLLRIPCVDFLRHKHKISLLKGKEKAKEVKEAQAAKEAQKAQKAKVQ